MRHFYLTLIFVLAISVSKAQSIYFPPTTSNTWDTISPNSLGYCQNEIDSLYNYLNLNNTKAFLLLQDGKIVLEKYFGTHTASDNWFWASAGKCLTSTLVGIAQQENKLKITDTTSKYLGQGWTSCTPQQEAKITIRNQLTMTSGLNDTLDTDCTIDSCLNYKTDPNTRWSYHNAPYTLLDSVIENATGVSMNSYNNTKIKQVTGMNGAFFKSGFNNIYYSTARSMARFGLLILNKGKWDNTSVLTDTNYFNQMTQTSQTINPSYGYLWWLNGKGKYMIPQTQIVFNGNLSPNAPNDMIAAMGSKGQLLNVVPSKNMIWVRMGENPTTEPVPFLMNDQIWKYINKLPCTPTQLSDNTKEEFIISPNPVGQQINIQSTRPIELVSIYNLQGQLLFQQNEKIIDMTAQPAGMYILHCKMNNGAVVIKRLVKQY